jgi:hypothetical protein
MAHQIITKETGAGMRQFRIVYRDLNTSEIVNMVDTWADTVNEVYRETLKVSLSAGVISELVDNKWIERLGFSNPAVEL